MKMVWNLVKNTWKKFVNISNSSYLGIHSTGKHDRPAEVSSV
jgi:hypothetical protein